MEPTDLTLSVLREIRDEGKRTNERLEQLSGRIEQTNSRLDQTNERLDQTNENLDQLARRVVEPEVRTATAITALAGSIIDLGNMLRQDRDLRNRVERCEVDIAALKARLAG